MTIWKFGLKIVDEQQIEMPYGSQIEHVGMQGTLTLWARVNPNAPDVPRTILVRGTGHDVPDNAIHLGTVIDHPFVWHVYEPGPT